MDEFAKLLIVDDNPKYLSEALPMYGYTVQVVTNGIDALKVLENDSGNIDLILLDVMMPQMDGWDTLKAIRSNDKTFQTYDLTNTDSKISGQVEVGSYLVLPISINK